MKKVITYGTFDLTHIGHINLLKKAKSLGDYLIVGLSNNEFNSLKNKTTIFTFEHRVKIIEALRYVDLVIPEITWEQKIQDIIDYKVDLLVMVDDWSGKFDFLKEYCEVIYVPRTSGISTSQIKKIIKDTK